MEFNLITQFVIISLDPDKGKIVINNTHFRYTLTGAVLMDFLLNGEISLSNKRLVPLFRNNGDLIHDMFADKISRSSKPRRVSFWIRRLSGKSRFVFKETIHSLIEKGLLRHERRYFLNIFPYNRYFIHNVSYRSDIIEGIREILLHNKTASNKQSMLIGLIKASGASRILVKEKGERSILRKRCNDFLQKDVIASETEKAIREVQAAIIASITAANVAASASH
jgi:hypothetical protein